MATVEGGKLQYEIDIETAKLVTGSRKASDVLGYLNKAAQNASGGFDKIDGAGRKAADVLGNVSSNAKSAGNNLSSASKGADQLGGGFTKLAGLVKGYITVQAALKLVETAQEFELLATRVNMASKSAAEGAQNLRALMAISSQNGSDLKETVNLFSQMSATLKSVGATSGDVQQLVNTLQKIGTIGGSSQQEMNNALRQFMQSMASGRVQAEEFNSIIEQMPELGRQIAQGMGVPFDQLRQLMLSGKLDIGSVLEAVYKQTDDVNKKFEDMPRTVSQASNSLINSFGRAISQVDEQIKATKYLAKLLDGAAVTLDLVSGNASPELLIGQKLLKNAEDLKAAENSLSLAKKTGYEWATKSAQATVDRLKAEKKILDLAKVTNQDFNNAASGKVAKGGNQQPEYIQNLAKKSATNSAQAIINAGKSQVESLQIQRNQLKANFDKQLVDKDTFAKADAVLSSKIAEAQSKGSEKGGGKAANPYSQGEASIESFQRQLGVLALRYDENSKEAAQFNAVQAVGEHATEAQKARISDLAGALFDAKQKQADFNAAIENDAERKESKSYTDSATQLKRQYAENIISQEAYNQQSADLERQHQVNLAKIRAEKAAGVSPLQDAQGTIDPVQALANENAQKLALIQQFEQQKIITQQQSISLMNAANTQYEQARINAAWQIWQNQSQANQLLSGAIDSLQGGATNAITGLLSGTQSLSESFANIGTTILNSVVGGLVEMGLQYVKNMLMGQAAATAALATTTAQATAAASAWAPAAISASIATMGAATTAGTAAYSTALVASKGLAIAGARKNGGPVSAGSMYQVGEGGKPEIYQASTGKQFMIPGDNGKVISNKDMQGSGGGGTSVQQNVHFNIQTTNGIDDATMQKMVAMMKTVSLNQMKDQSTRPGGMLQPRK